MQDVEFRAYIESTQTPHLRWWAVDPPPTSAAKGFRVRVETSECRVQGWGYRVCGAGFGIDG